MTLTESFPIAGKLPRQIAAKYLIRHRSEGPDQYYLTGFLKLNGTLYADAVDLKVNEGAYDAKTRQEVPTKYELGTHNIMKVTLHGDTLGIRMMALDYLDKCLVSKKYKLPYKVYTDQSSDYNTGSTIYITASTAELQAFLKNYGGDPKLFAPETFFHREDSIFNGYFPKESWITLALLGRPDVPPMLKHSYGEMSAIRNPGPAIIDSLEQAPAIYKPFYFQVASAYLINGNKRADCTTTARYTRYVLEHTNEFLHFFTSYNRYAERAIGYWATAVRDAGTRDNTLDATISQLKASCNNCRPKEKQILYKFIQTIRPDRDAYRAAAEKNKKADNIPVIEVDATPIKVSAAGDPIQLVHPSGDSIYLLTAKPFYDSVLAQVTHVINLEPKETQPITDHLQLDPRTWKGYVLYHGVISPLNSVDPILRPGTGEKEQAVNSRTKLTITHWIVREEQPVCNAYKYIPGERPGKCYLINYCADSTKIIATTQDYILSTFRCYMRHHCIPVSYTDANGNTYAVVVTQSVRDGEQPLAHVLVSDKNKLTVYRVWIKNGNKGASSLYCFAQNGYCYLYDRFNGGLGDKDAYLYRFPLADH